MHITAPLFLVAWFTAVLGVKFNYPSGQGVLSREFMEVGVEKQIGQIVRSIVKPDSIFYDIGMNAGYFSLLAASLGAEVISFEPQLTCIEVMRASLNTPMESSKFGNAHLMKQITLVNVGLGSAPASIIRVPKGECNPGFGQTNTSTAVEIPTPVLPAGVFLKLHSRIDFIKLDTEGSEVRVVEDFVHHARNYKNVVVEIMPRAWEAHGGAALEHGLQVFKRFRSLATEAYLLSDSTPFKIAKKQIKSKEVEGELYTDFNIEELIHDRYNQKCGCNVWFKF